MKINENATRMQICKQTSFWYSFENVDSYFTEFSEICERRNMLNS